VKRKAGPIGILQTSKAGLNTTFALIAKRLRGEVDISREPLPERWVELIRRLDAQEMLRATSERGERKNPDRPE
jgi:hypothetical protein